MKVRRACSSDSKDIWNWRNDPKTRENSVNQNEVSWSDHHAWFTHSLANDSRAIYIGLCRNSGDSMGVVLFDFDADLATSEVSINIAPQWRRKSHSKDLLKSAIKEFQSNRAYVMTAKIKSNNIASIKCFEGCGFTLEATSDGFLIYKSKQAIIDAIEQVRSTNNVNWMDLLRLAFKVAPKEAQEIVRRINNDDGKISDLLKRLGN